MTVLVNPKPETPEQTKLNSKFTENFKTTPYWIDDVSQDGVSAPPLPTSVDVAVVGSGYTGLNAAIQTLRGGRSTLVFESETLGWGCSTRNGGQISTSIKPSYDRLTLRFNRRRARAILQEGVNALAWIEEFIKSEKIDCGFEVCGRFHGAHNARAYKKLGASLRGRSSEDNHEAHLVSRSEQRTELGTDAYHGGIVYPKHAAIHPAKYHAALVKMARDAGGLLYAHCPVLEIERQGITFKLRTPKGVVSARNVILATNGYTGKISPWQRRRIIPIGSYIIATEPLAEGLIDELMPRHRIYSDSRKVVHYYRASPDRTRILFGGRVSHNETDTRQSGLLLHQNLVEIFPELHATRVSHSWMGFVGYTFETLAHVGKHDGMHYAMGFCGSGVSMASYLGMRVGQQVLEDPQGQTGFDGVRFPTRTFYNGNPWFLPHVLRYYQWRDRQSF